jgi:hypothetical protein
MLKKALTMFSLLVVCLIASQQVFAYFDRCDDLGNGVWAHHIFGDDGRHLYSEIQFPDGTSRPYYGEIPEDWIIKPNGKAVNIWEEAKRIRLENPTMSTAEILSEFVPVEDKGDTITSLENHCGNLGYTDVLARRFYIDCSNTFKYDPTPFIANVSIAETSNQISINTDKPVSIKIVDYLTGAELISTSTNNKIDIPISNLSGGCRYSIIVEQVIDDKTCKIRTHNFCKKIN